MEFIGAQGTWNNALFWPCKSFGSPHVWLSGRNAHLLIFIRWSCHTHNWSQTSHLFWKGYDPPPSITYYLLLHSAPCWFGVMIIAFSLGVCLGLLLCKLALLCMCVKSMLSLLFPLNALSRKMLFPMPFAQRVCVSIRSKVYEFRILVFLHKKHSSTMLENLAWSINTIVNCLLF